MNGLDLIKLLKPAAFKYTDEVPTQALNDGKVYFGFMAQDIDAILSHNEFAIVKKLDNGYFVVDYTQLIAPAVKAIQQLSNEVDELKAKVSNLENKNE